jgi:hypothetical protein
LFLVFFVWFFKAYSISFKRQSSGNQPLGLTIKKHEQQQANNNQPITKRLINTKERPTQQGIINATTPIIRKQQLTNNIHQRIATITKTSKQQLTRRKQQRNKGKNNERSTQQHNRLKQKRAGKETKKDCHLAVEKV